LAAFLVKFEGNGGGNFFQLFFRGSEGCRKQIPGISGPSVLRSQFFSYLCSPIFYKAMYAIVDIAGKQFKVAKDQYIYAPKMDGEAGAAVSFDKVLLVDDGGNVQIGAPTVSGIKVSGKILEHVKGNKVIVFKKKRRKGYVVKNGHRQQYTKVQIENIG
jgi:large subunit ribosomal protein L21